MPAAAPLIRSAIYARVSTTDQNNEIQLTELQRYNGARGWPVVEVHQDTMSGAKDRRPGLEALMESARARRIDVVTVLRLDRFGRSTTDLLNNIKELKSLGVRFLATAQGLDTDESNPVAKFLIDILAAVASLEREIMLERQRQGIAARRAKGLHMGRLPKVFRRDAAVEMRRAGCSIRAIARELKVSPSAIHDYLSGKVVIADGPKVAENTGPAGPAGGRSSK